TKLVTTAYFDNSANNPLNPDPSKTIRWGEPSNEEMMGFWLAYADTQPVQGQGSPGASPIATVSSARPPSPRD
ncbi:MAG TPA: hypothetical protein VGE93_16720, partial [Bryobacteraceae bacterium]